MANACVFCGSTSGRLTDQHVFGQWLANRMTGLHGVVTMTGSNDSSVSFRQKPFEDVAKVACRDCNSNWMQKLESRARLILEEMLDTGSRVLRPKDQRNLAAWAAEVAMMADHLHPKQRVIPEVEYHYLKSYQQPPKTTRVFLGRVEPVQFDGGFLGGAMQKGRVAKLEVEAGAALTYEQVEGWYRSGGRIYGLTIAVDQILFQIVGHNLPITVSTDYPKNVVREIWPIGQRFTWPNLPAATSIRAMHGSLIGKAAPEST